MNKRQSKGTGTDEDKIEDKRKQRLKIFYFHYSLMYGLMIALVIVVGVIMKTVFKLDSQTISKNSIITGIPFIRQRFFEIPVVINLLCPLLLIYLFYADENIRCQHKLLRKYLSKLNFGFFFSNWLLLICFFLNYHQLILPISKLSGMKISGHVLAIMLSGNIFLNIHQICDYFEDNYPSYRNKVNFVCFAIRFLLGHSLYTLFWTAWVFHDQLDLVISLIVSLIYIFILKCCSIDYLVFCLVNNSLPPKKAKNIIWSNN